MDNYDVAGIVKKHLAAEFNCAEKDFDSYKLVVTELKESGNCAMKAACYGGSAVFSVLPKMIPDFRRIFEGKDPDWIFETKTLIMLSEILYLHGHTIDDMYQYSIPDFNLPKTESKYDIEIAKSGFDRFSSEPLAKEVFDLESHGPVSLLLTAKKNGKVIGMAAAFDEGDFLWQLNLAVAPEERFGFAAENILACMKDAVIDCGKIPFFGGASCKISPNTGANAGFYPCWTRIVSRPRNDEFLNLHGTR
ncbi:MAG: hypothetical protein IJA17_07705 [Oscillospiraceae bacterium]|nr:hypothetical protein [Oscillospiraceae bacterium]